MCNLFTSGSTPPCYSLILASLSRLTYCDQTKFRGHSSSLILTAAARPKGHVKSDSSHNLSSSAQLIFRVPPFATASPFLTGRHGKSFLCCSYLRSSTRLSGPDIYIRDVLLFFPKRFVMIHQHPTCHWKSWKKCTAVPFMLRIINGAYPP